MGDTVNVASRLHTAAAPGEIYVTQATFRLTNREFTFREVGPVEMKGKERPVLVYALSGERGIGKTRLLTEFIGLATSAEDGTRVSDAPRVMRWTFSRVNQRSYAGFMEPLLVELGIDPNDSEAATKLTGKLRALGFANPELVMPTLAQFLHLPGSPEPPSDTEEWKRSLFIVVYDVIA